MLSHYFKLSALCYVGYTPREAIVGASLFSLRGLLHIVSFPMGTGVRHALTQYEEVLMSVVIVRDSSALNGTRLFGLFEDESSEIVQLHSA